NLETDQIYLGSSLLAIREKPVGGSTAVVKYQHTDALGSPVVVTRQNRDIVEETEYEPYGQVLNRPMHDGPGYTGHVEDAATGLVYMQQRYYDPQLGVFLSVDPVTAYSNPVVQFHRYRYANSNPYRFIDPDGRYGRGTGWKDRDWKRFDRAQQSAAKRLDKAAAKIARALETGKGLKGVTRAFERTFGAGSGTAENMGKVASSMSSMADALRDDGSKGYVASAVDIAARTGDAKDANTPAATPRGTREMWVNTQHQNFRSFRDMRLNVAHESAHPPPLSFSDQAVRGDTAYSRGDAAQQAAFGALAESDPAAALVNPDHLVRFGVGR